VRQGQRQNVPHGGAGNFGPEICPEWSGLGRAACHATRELIIVICTLYGFPLQRFTVFMLTWERIAERKA
jgi:hypothetical protein